MGILKSNLKSKLIVVLIFLISIILSNITHSLDRFYDVVIIITVGIAYGITFTMLYQRYLIVRITKSKNMHSIKTTGLFNWILVAFPLFILVVSIFDESFESLLFLMIIIISIFYQNIFYCNENMIVLGTKIFKSEDISSIKVDTGIFKRYVITVKRGLKDTVSQLTVSKRYIDNVIVQFESLTSLEVKGYPYKGDVENNA